MRNATQVNYLYFRRYVLSLPGAPGFKVLDYGCGGGDVVSLLRESGIDCHGCDIFYEGGSAGSSPTAERLKQGGFMLRIDEEGELPYPPGSFDVILANMVFEHVRDLDGVLGRLRRILKDGGHILAHFPTREVIREGHMGIPFVHWFRSGSKVRSAYTRALRALGFGYFKEQDSSPSAWVDRQLSWIDRYCFYRSLPELRQSFNGQFALAFNEMEYMRFRADNRWWLAGLLSLPGLGELWSWIFRRVAFTSLVLRPISVSGRDK